MHDGEPKSVAHLTTNLFMHERIQFDTSAGKVKGRHATVQDNTDDARYAADRSDNAHNSTIVVTATSTTRSKEKTQRMYDPDDESDSDGEDYVRCKRRDDRGKKAKVDLNAIVRKKLFKIVQESAALNAPPSSRPQRNKPQQYCG